MLDSFPLALFIAGLAYLFKWWVKYKVVDQKKVGHGCNDIDEGLELAKQKLKNKKGLCFFRCLKFSRNVCEEQKKRPSPHKFPAFHKWAVGCEQQIKGFPCHSKGG